MAANDFFIVLFYWALYQCLHFQQLCLATVHYLDPLTGGCQRLKASDHVEHFLVYPALAQAVKRSVQVL